MNSKKKGTRAIEIPRGKLIGENGPGSIYVDTEGISYLISAVDKWYFSKNRIDIEKFEIHEPRLENLLSVNCFREVPEYRKPVNTQEKVNTEISIPLQRFPLAHYCSSCGYFKDFRSTHALKKAFCEICNKKNTFIQFPIIIVCEDGHLSDFPYFRYVHLGEKPGSGNHKVKLVREGSSILNWSIACECGLNHSLGGVTGQSKDDNITPFQREMKGKAKCFGDKPWAGEKNCEDCDKSPTAILKNSINSYRPETLPVLSISTEEVIGNSSFQQILSDEFMRLNNTILENPDKLISLISFESKDSIFKKVNFVFKLEELVVQTGFHRLTPSDEEQTLKKALSSTNKKMIFSKDTNHINWYPAKKLYGEGIFIEFNADVLNKWSEDKNVQAHFKKYCERTENFYLSDKFETPIDIMIHTLSHAFMRQLSLKSGYPLASIKEKLYLNEGEYGILAYVTDSDKEGTFGGLVRLAEEKKFKEIINQALKSLDWCSSDPVCFETGVSTGQGIQYSNGAACHNCCFVPSTSCSYRNCFLDRDYIGRSESPISITKNYSTF